MKNSFSLAVAVALMAVGAALHVPMRRAVMRGRQTAVTVRLP